jgi:hypothetical protein
VTHSVIQSLVDDTFTYCDSLFLRVKHKLALCAMSDENIFFALFGFKCNTNENTFNISYMHLHHICTFT